MASVHGQLLSPGNLAIPALAHDSMIVEYYAPHGADRQVPHMRDERYMIISWRGIFQNGPARHPFAPGDVIFFPAGIEHRFEEFAADFATWVIFYEPEGAKRCSKTWACRDARDTRHSCTMPPTGTVPGLLGRATTRGWHGR